MDDLPNPTNDRSEDTPTEPSPKPSPKTPLWMKAAMTVLILAAVLIPACSAFDFGDLVKVRTPIGIQQSEGYPATMTYNNWQAEFQAWYDDVQRQGTQWRNEGAKASEVIGLLQQFTMAGLDAFGPTVAGIPVIGPAASMLLTGGVGLLAGIGGNRKGREQGKQEQEGRDRPEITQRQARIAELEKKNQRLEDQLLARTGGNA